LSSNWKARLELLDMGLRANPQLNYRSGSRSLDIIDEQSTKIFEQLKPSGIDAKAYLKP